MESSHQQGDQWGLDAELRGTNKKIERSCLVCHRRKIRCSKQLPCSSCTRTGVTCSYPEQGRKRRAPKTRITDIATRISQLERTIVSASRASDPILKVTSNTETPRWAGPTPHTPHSQTTQDGGGTPKEALVQNQYFNETLLSRVIEEERDIQCALATPRDDPPILRIFNPMGILSNPVNFTHGIATLHPSKQIAIQLWRIFVQNVETAVKVLHTPTAEVTIYTVIDNVKNASQDALALAFSIYFSSTTTLEPDEAERLLGRDKESAMRLFKTGMEQAIAEADFLNRTNTMLLQAVAIYLVAIRSHNPGRGVWILTGMAVRAAESIGLHRDGKKLGLTPFESEMRRRIWWHIIGRDGRALEDYGISSSSNIPLHSVALPLNVEDSALYPEMTELPPASTGWTSMTFPLAAADLARARHQLQMALTASPPPSDAAREEIMRDLRARLEFQLRCCNPVIPIQRLTMNVSRFILAKLEFVTRQQWQHLHHPDQPDSFASDETFLDACQCLETGLEIWQDEMIYQFHWIVRSYTQYHLPLYILWQLCVRPQGPHVDRAWGIIEALFELHDSGVVQLAASGSGPKWAVMRLLKDKASALRTALQNGDKASQALGSNVRSIGRSPDGDVTDESGINIGLGSDTDWSQVVDQIPDWSTFLEGLSMEGIDFGGNY